MNPPEYASDGYMFRPLSDTERAQFEQYARENDPPKNDTWQIYHPACRAVWTARGLCPEDKQVTRENPT